MNRIQYYLYNAINHNFFYLFSNLTCFIFLKIVLLTLMSRGRKDDFQRNLVHFESKINVITIFTSAFFQQTVLTLGIGYAPCTYINFLY